MKATSWSFGPDTLNAWRNSGYRYGNEAVAGLYPTAMTFVADRRVAALGSDGHSDTAASTTQGVAFPIRVLAINAMGVHLLDYLTVEEVFASHVRPAG